MSEEKKEAHDLFGVSKEEADKAQDIVPTFNLGDLEVGKSHRFTIVSAQPKSVEFEDKKERDEEGKPVKKSQLVLEAIDALTGMKVALWLSAKSLRLEFMKLYRAKGTLENVPVVVAVREYEHDQWGKVRGYSVQEDKSVEDFTPAE